MRWYDTVKISSDRQTEYCGREFKAPRVPYCIDVGPIWHGVMIDRVITEPIGYVAAISLQ